MICTTVLYWHIGIQIMISFVISGTPRFAVTRPGNIIGMPRKPPIPFSHKFHNADPSALRLLERLLAFDPKDRPTAEEVYFLGAKRITPYVQLISKAISAHA